MVFDHFHEQVRTVAELEAIVGTPVGLSLKKERTSLDGHMRTFIAHSPFVLLGTHRSDGLCDVSPRGDAPGFVHVVDDRTLLIPERAGNKRVDSQRNILETGRVGLIFLIPGFGETLRVNGQAAIVRDDAFLTPLTAQGKKPLVAVAVRVEECFLQCAKALLRSKLWKPEAWPDLATLPSAAQMLSDHAQMPELDCTAMEARLANAYKNNLY